MSKKFESFKSSITQDLRNEIKSIDRSFREMSEKISDQNAEMVESCIQLRKHTERFVSIEIFNKKIDETVLYSEF